MIDSSNWYISFFKGITQEFWAKLISSEFTTTEIAFIDRVHSLQRQQQILDLPCGNGRHSLELAKQGHQLLSLDISEDSIQQLTIEKERLGLDNIEAVTADVLSYSLPSGFHLALCLGNSFSYFPKEEMEQFCQKIAEGLLPKGTFIINTGMLAENILPNLEKQLWMEVEDIYFLMENRYHPLEGVLQTDYKFIKYGKVEERTSYHFIYTLSEIIDMLKAVEFKTIHVYGGVGQESFELGSPQTYLVAEK